MDQKRTFGIRNIENALQSVGVPVGDAVEVQENGRHRKSLVRSGLLLAWDLEPDGKVLLFVEAKEKGASNTRMGWEHQDGDIAFGLPFVGSLPGFERICTNNSTGRAETVRRIGRQFMKA